MTQSALVLYDDACPLCTTLAKLMAKRECSGLSFESWQEFKKRAPRSIASTLLAQDATALRFWDGTELYEGEIAWSALIERCQDLKALAWLAAKLNLSRSQSGSLLMHAAHALKWFCRRCGRRI